jgi:exopolysaccharide biosynthesis polyprenyl glycosylphosphotransferase
VILVTDVVMMTAAIVLTDGVFPGAAVYVILVPTWLGLLGFYQRRIAPTVQVDMLPLLGALACPAFVLAVIPTHGADRLLHDVPATAVAVVVGRLLSYQVQRTARGHRACGTPTLIVGAGVLGCQVARVLMDHPAYGMRPVGFVDGFGDDGTLPLPVLGGIDDFDRIVRDTGARRIVVAFGSSRETDLVAVLRASDQAQVEVHILPRLFEIGVTPSGPDTDIVWGFPLQRARRGALRSPAWRTKRILDVAVSGLTLLLFLPILAAVALAVRLTSKGPILFRQERVGQRGEVVQVAKFRSMRVNDDSDTRWGGNADDRITPIGKVLRATSLDELPQLVSVLKGDMSLVGPRPERPHFHSQFDQRIVRYRDRLRVPVGVTGWAQVHGLRGDTSIEERARFDNYYIEHWSLWFDLVILMRTVGQVVKEVWRTVRPSSKALISAAMERSEIHAEAPVDVTGLLGHPIPAEAAGPLAAGGLQLGATSVIED